MRVCEAEMVFSSEPTNLTEAGAYMCVCSPVCVCACVCEAEMVFSSEPTSLTEAGACVFMYVCACVCMNVCVRLRASVSISLRGGKSHSGK